MATTQSITVYRGERATLDFTMSPVEDIAGWHIHFTVAKKENSTTKLIGPVEATILVSGQFRVSLDEEDLDLTPGSYAYDVWRTDEGFEEVLALGSFVVTGNARVPPLEVT